MEPLLAATHHVFVDYENIKGVDPDIFRLESATFTLLLGPQNRALDVHIVQRLMQRAASVELVRLDAAGRNAVDFALAYYLGRKIAADPAGVFHLVSKDKGYDPLVAHLVGRGVLVHRHDDFQSVLASAAPKPAKKTPTPRAPRATKAATTAAKPARAPRASTAAPKAPAPPAKSAPIPIPLPLFPHEAFLGKAQNALRREKDRPKRRSSLIGYLHSRIGKERPMEEIKDLLATLEEVGFLHIDDKNHVTYSFEGDNGAS